MSAAPVELPDGPTEESTERDGVLSYSKEWHALALGVLAVLADRGRDPLAAVAFVATVALGLQVAQGPVSQAASEPWYALAGLVLGLVLLGAIRVADRLTPDPEAEEETRGSG